MTISRIIAVSVVITASVAYIAHRKPHHIRPSDSQLAKSTVMVVRSDERSGGTGSIIFSAATESYILTNNHVCEVVANGGLVITDDNSKYEVVSYKQSQVHDICLITVYANLHNKIDLATSAPDLYSEAIVAGHPALLPTIIGHGHFSHRHAEDVSTGKKQCTDEDLKSPNAIYCLFLGGIPIVRRYETQVISALIEPGSSGSAVYNLSGELEGLVFAGSGEINYGFIVPYEYIANFLNEELSKLPVKYPNTTSILASSTSDSKKFLDCRKFKDKKLSEMCRLMLKTDGLIMTE